MYSSMERAWNDERGEREFEKMTKITQYRHNINTSIKKRVTVSFYITFPVVYLTLGLPKNEKIYFLHVQRPTNTFLIFDVTFL